MSWFNRLSNLLHREDLGRELDEELQFHIDARIRDNLNAGMTVEAARRDARRRFGNWALAKEKTHEMNIIVSIQTVGQDLRYALRSLRKSPGFTALAVLAMALGIGANTAVFTVVNGVLLRPLPLVQPERLFLISYKQQLGPFAGGPGLEDHHYLEFQRRTHAFERVTTFGKDQVTLTGAGDAVRLTAAMVTSSFFPVLRVSPAMGRTFAAQEEQPGAPGVAVLSEELWRSRFAADPNILGKAITLEGIKRNVIGVMPAGFAFPGDSELWLPLSVGADPGNSYFRPAFGRLLPSVSQQQAQAELETLVPQFPVAPTEKWHGRGDSPSQRSARRRDSKIASHLHGSRRLRAADCVRQCGQPATDEGIPAPSGDGSAHGSGSAPETADPPVADRECAAFARRRRRRTAVGDSWGPRPARTRAGRKDSPHRRDPPGCLGAGFRSWPWGRHRNSVWPAARGPGDRTGVAYLLSHVGRSVTGRGEGLRGVLVVSEIALALVLLTGAGLLLKSFLRLRAVNPGFRPENVLTMTVDLPESLYKTRPACGHFTRALWKSYRTCLACRRQALLTGFPSVAL